MTQQLTTRAEFPEKLKCLFEPKRYKILYGGRGAGRSWGAIRALLLLGTQKPLRVPCCREIQDSIKQSVHMLLCDQIKNLQLETFYTIQNEVIRGINGTEFTFHGLKHNVNNIKSLEGADIVLVEEGANVSKDSWDKLIPTVRKEGSEIWVLFNPELDTDETYTRFVVNPPPNAAVVKMTWRDNPWFPEVLHQELDAMRVRDPDSFLNVWEGHCRQSLDGAIYANELRQAQEDGRIGKVPYDRSKGVHVFFDLGWSDMTSCWFIQRVAMEYRVLASYQNRHMVWNHYLNEIQSRKYVIDTIWLPHDAQSSDLKTGKTIEEITKNSGYKVRIVPKLDVEEGINVARTIFPDCWFDANACADGLQALRRYRYDKNTKGQFMRSPLHDDSSHYADSWRYFAVGFREGKPVEERHKQLHKRLQAPVITLELGPNTGQGWMR